MAQPVELLDNVKGMARDFGVDRLPKGFLWDLVDIIPDRKGANIEQRGPWAYFGTQDYGNTIWGGRYTLFNKGQKLILNANSRIWDVNINSGAATDLAAGMSSMKQNGVKLRDRVYFLDGAGSQVPKVITYDGATVAVADVDSTAPKAKVGIAYKDRLVLGGDPANPSNVYFSALETDGGPPAAWDPLAFVGTSAEVTGLAGLQAQILVFHPSMIERIRGGVPPGTDLDTDMYVDTLTDQVGCNEPQTICSWRENIIFADERGVFLTDGATVKNLAELGGMGDFWRLAYGNRVSGASVSAGIFLDYLILSIITLDNIPVTMVCDLNARTWFRFRNFPATCFIPSEGPIEEQFCGNKVTRQLMKMSPVFVDEYLGVRPPPDYVDGNGVPVTGYLTTGFKRLGNEEGMARIRNIRVSYHHQSYVRPPVASGLEVEYRTNPPVPEEIDSNNPSLVTGWTVAGEMPDTTTYSRKKVPVGKNGFGIMVRVRAVSSSRTSRFFSVGVERTLQDRGKDTTR